MDWKLRYSKTSFTNINLQLSPACSLYHPGVCKSDSPGIVTLISKSLTRKGTEALSITPSSPQSFTPSREQTRKRPTASDFIENNAVRIKRRMGSNNQPVLIRCRMFLSTVHQVSDFLLTSHIQALPSECIQSLFSLHSHNLLLALDQSDGTDKRKNQTKKADQMERVDQVDREAIENDLPPPTIQPDHQSAKQTEKNEARKGIKAMIIYGACIFGLGLFCGLVAYHTSTTIKRGFRALTMLAG